MRIEILGSGGSIPTPRPGCSCPLCESAREQGVPAARSGPSLFIHGPDLLVDTPEEIGAQLNRAGILSVPCCIYSHWHPDHVMGRRVWEMNQDWEHWPPHHRRTDIYLPEQVAADFKTSLGTWEHLSFLEGEGFVRLRVLTDGQAIELNGCRVEPIRLAQDYVYAFVLTEGTRRVLIAPDELFGWAPPPELAGMELVVLPIGAVEINPLTGRRAIPKDHPVLEREATFAQTVEIVRALRPKRAVLTHIEETDRLSLGELAELELRLQREGLPVSFAFDTMSIEV